VICILRFKPLLTRAKSVDRRWLPPPADQISHWLLATDLQDARCRAAQHSEHQELVAALYEVQSLPAGKHRLTDEYIALVS
jgi:hypothetical protein